MLRICLLSVLAGTLLPGLVAAAAAADRIAGAARVIDGDGLRIAGLSLRLHGIDAPERDQTCLLAGEDWACGLWAKAELEALIDGREVICVLRAQDRYGRSIATCEVGGADLSEAMVRRGAAFAYRAFALDYVDAEKAAMIEGVGLWAAEVTPPAEHRAAAHAAAHAAAEATGAEDAAAAGSCAVKGNISAAGRVYHLPGQADYAATRIDPARGERWFCSAEEAEAAGWRPAAR